MAQFTLTNKLSAHLHQQEAESQLGAAVPTVSHGQPKASQQMVGSAGSIIVYEQAADGVVHPVSERQAEHQVLHCPTLVSAALTVTLIQLHSSAPDSRAVRKPC